MVGVKKEKIYQNKIQKNYHSQPVEHISFAFQDERKTKGGLIMRDNLERQQVASQTGLVLRMGPDCYRDKDRYPEGPWCKEGQCLPDMLDQE